MRYHRIHKFLTVLVCDYIFMHLFRIFITSLFVSFFCRIMASQQYYKLKCMPTVTPADAFDAKADAEALRTIMKGTGAVPVIVELLTGRANCQRIEIAETFKTLYGMVTK